MKMLPLALLLALAACGSRFSADEYATRAVQQANPVQPGVVIGARRVAIAADGAAGAGAGAAAGGVVGGAAGGNSITSALGAVGGALVGGLIGTTAERAAVNTDGVEYIIRRLDRPEELVSVVQRDAVPLAVGTRVLVIAGAQARVVPDYTDGTLPPGVATPGAAPAPAPAAPAPAREALPAPAAQPAPVAAPAPVAPPPVVPAPPPPV